MTAQTVKIVIITERVILEKVTRLIEECGATGYTFSAVGGKGDRGQRSERRAVLSDAQANVKIEVIAHDRAMAEMIAERMAKQYFVNYSGITYLEPVEILRPEKF